MKKLAISALILATSSILMADGAATFNTKCASCHGANGKTPALGKSAIIAGQSSAVLLKKLQGYKAGTLNTNGMGAVMKGNVAAMDAKTLSDVAAYISKLK
ncbi:MAG: c-type cytochrome [Sulfurovaceae bacterium]|nr:c-type cytochrome [Sulfurovaceae bacterium]